MKLLNVLATVTTISGSGARLGVAGLRLDNDGFHEFPWTEGDICLLAHDGEGWAMVGCSWMEENHTYRLTAMGDKLYAFGGVALDAARTYELRVANGRIELR